MDLSQQQRIAAAFALGVPQTIQSLGGTRNENYRLATDLGTWFVRRRFPGYSEPDRVEFDHAALKFLASRGVAVPSPRTTADHGTWFKDGDALWEVFPFVDGTSPSEGSMSQARALGSALGRFHAEGRAFHLRHDKIGPRGETCVLGMLDIATRIDREQAGCTVPLRHYRKWVVEAAEKLPMNAYLALPHTLVHGDIQPANLIMHEDHVAAFVDFDWCAWRPRVYDLAFAVLLCCSFHTTPIDGHDIWSLTQEPTISGKLAGALLDAYEETAGLLCSLERAALIPQITLSWCHCRLAGALKVAPDRRADFLARPPDCLEKFLPHFE